MRIIGVDGCPQGWIAATVDFTSTHANTTSVQQISFQIHTDLASIVADSTAHTVGVDMPIGLPSQSGTRLCDVEARKILSPFGSRVFPAPVRVALAHADDYAQACAVSREECGRAMSRQTWNILAKIAEADVLADDHRLVEVHPEVSFALMRGTPIAERKKTAEGRRIRLAALQGWLPPDVAVPRSDDAVDALACAWTAMRITTGQARTLPGTPPPLDDHGRPMRIVV
jgi:predicted RNase H-like nuclease